MAEAGTCGHQNNIISIPEVNCATVGTRSYPHGYYQITESMISIESSVKATQS